MRIFALAVLAAAAAGCGSSGTAPDPNAQGTKGPSVGEFRIGEAVPSSLPVPGAKVKDESTGGAPPPSSDDAGRRPRPRSTPTGPPLRISAELDSTCVAHGEKQSVTVKTNYSNAVVAHDVKYSDNTYAGPGQGGGGGRTDSDGEYSATWVVPPTAPTGQTTVLVAADNGSGARAVQELFTVRTPTGSC